MTEERKKKCLLIDDDDDDRLIFSSTINKYFPCFDLESFSSFEKGKVVMNDSTNQHDISIVFLDLNMPKTNGLTALKEIRSDASKFNLPVVIYSTSNNPDDVNECLKAGATAFITKPSSIDELVQEIGVYLIP